MPSPALPAMRSSVRLPVEDDRPDVDWAVAIADGPRLHDCLAQLNQLTPAARTMTVLPAACDPGALPLQGRSDHVFAQPAARDATLAPYVALAMIRRWHPNAIVTLVSSAGYFAPTSRYLAALAGARAVASAHRELVVVLGGEVPAPMPDTGYFGPGDDLPDAPAASRVAAVVGAPGVPDTLWHTGVACGSLDAFWALGRVASPSLVDTLDALVPLVGTEDEDDALDYIYRARPPIRVTRALRARIAPRLALLPMPEVAYECGSRATAPDESLAAFLR